MAGTFLLEILTPEESFFCDSITSVIFPTEDGEMSIQKGHELLVATVVPGEAKINTGSKWLYCAVMQGFIEVRTDETVIFTQAAEWADQIDAARALAAKEHAEEGIRAKRSREEYLRCKIELARAQARLKVIKNIPIA